MRNPNRYPKADPYLMALEKRDRAEAAIKRLAIQREAARAVGNAPLQGRLGFQINFVWKPSLAEALADIEAHRPKIQARTGAAA